MTLIWRAFIAIYVLYQMECRPKSSVYAELAYFFKVFKLAQLISTRLLWILWLNCYRTLFNLIDSFIDLNGELPSTADGRIRYKQDPVTSSQTNRIWCRQCPCSFNHRESLCLSQTLLSLEADYWGRPARTKLFSVYLFICYAARRFRERRDQKYLAAKSNRA